jgi:hypothetical protein
VVVDTPRKQKKLKETRDSVRITVETNRKTLKLNLQLTQSRIQLVKGEAFPVPFNKSKVGTYKPSRPKNISLIEVCTSNKHKTPEVALGT